MLDNSSPYNPLADKVYMSPPMIGFFIDILKKLQHQVLQKEDDISNSIITSSIQEPDFLDRGIVEEHTFTQVSFQAYEQGLLQEIREALRRIDLGDYGYCQETGKEIGVKRLMAIPYTRYCVEVQSQKEKKRFPAYNLPC